MLKPFFFIIPLDHPVGNKKTYAEDVAVDAEGNAYVTDIKGCKIWKVGVNGEFLSIIKSPLFKSKGWFKSFFTLNGIVYHPNGYLLIVHTMSGNLFKIEIEKKENEEINVVKVRGGPLSYGDGMELLSPTKLLVAGHWGARLVESMDNWASANVVGEFRGPSHLLPTAVTVKDGKVYVNHLFGIGYTKKHVLVEAVFTSYNIGG